MSFVLLIRFLVNIYENIGFIPFIYHLTMELENSGLAKARLFCFILDVLVLSLKALFYS